MALPKIIYGEGEAAVTLQFARGPVSLSAYYAPRVHDNLASSGAVRERVVENLDILISFEMPHMLVADDLPAWGEFMAFALAGGEFDFYPDADLADAYACQLEDQAWEPRRTGPGKYGASVVLRVLQVEGAPANPAVVLERFYGVAAAE